MGTLPLFYSHVLIHFRTGHTYNAPEQLLKCVLSRVRRALWMHAHFASTHRLTAAFRCPRR
jgi:hypothetical protein